MKVTEQYTAKTLGATKEIRHACGDSSFIIGRSRFERGGSDDANGFGAVARARVPGGRRSAGGAGAAGTESRGEQSASRESGIDPRRDDAVPRALRRLPRPRRHRLSRTRSHRPPRGRGHRRADLPDDPERRPRDRDALQQGPRQRASDDHRVSPQDGQRDGGGASGRQRRQRCAPLRIAVRELSSRRRPRRTARARADADRRVAISGGAHT